MTAGDSARKHAAVAGLLAVAIVLAWQFLVAHFVFGGNWTSWFCIGGNIAQPSVLAAEHLYRFANNDGYDGQFYHYVAHDPLFRRGLDRYIDAPRLRYRRILLPGIAYLLAAGQDRFIDPALIVVNLTFVFAGAFWLSRYAINQGGLPLWGLLFLMLPATLVTIDRFTVDMALTALCVGFAVYVSEDRAGGLYLVLLLAPLARETGLLLTAACCGVLVFERRIKTALFFATSALPALLWFLFVETRTGPYDSTRWFSPIPFAGLVDRMIHPMTYPFVPAVRLAADVLDECALAGMALVFVLSFRWPARFPKPLAIAAALITVSGMMLGKPFWADVFAFGRVFSPLIVLTALQRFSARAWLPMLPLVLIDPRIGLQLGYRVFQLTQVLFP